jgi:hypothetical protein
VGGYAAAILVYNPLSLSLFGGSADAVPLADFGSFYASGQAAERGLDPYDVYPLTLDAGLGREGGAAVNLNAPISLPLFQALTLLDPVSARRGWFVVTLVAFGATLVLLMWAYPSFRGPLVVAWGLLLTGFVETLLLGQVYALLALVSTAAWLLLRRQRWVAAGGLIGFVVAFKPNFLVWPVLLFVAGHRRAGVAAVVAAVAFALVPVLVYGPVVYAQWLAALRLEAANAAVANASLLGWLTREGAPTVAGIVAGGALLVGLAVWAWRCRPSVTATSGAALAGLLLASPLAWVGYTLFLLPIVARSRLTPLLVIACGLLCIPRLVLEGWADGSALVRVTVGAAYSVAWLILLVLALRSGCTAVPLRCARSRQAEGVNSAEIVTGTPASGGGDR